MNIIPDPLQVLLNTVPFLVAIVGMYRIILRPMLDYLLGRDSAVSSGHDEAERISQMTQIVRACEAGQTKRQEEKSLKKAAKKAAKVDDREPAGSGDDEACTPAAEKPTDLEAAVELQ